jgi:integrase
MIRQENFNRRHWRPVLESLEIPYRRPYNTRHTFATLCLDAGVPVQQVAAWLGHSPTMTLKHYAGLTRSEVPEL